MTLAAPAFIAKRLHDVAVRTPRCNDIIRREPREIPRRLRGLLLAIDGRQPIRTYLDQLDGFGDVESLLAELATLGLIEFKSARRRPRAPTEPGPASDSRQDSNFGDSAFADSNYFSPDTNFGGDSVFGPGSAAPQGGAKGARRPAGRPPAAAQEPPADRRPQPFSDTLPGSFDELVQVARLSHPGYDPTSAQGMAAIAHPSADLDAQRQVDSLFVLLDTVRSERRELKERIGQLKKQRDLAEKLVRQNRHLLTAVCVLAGLCLLLALTHLLRG